MNTIMSSATSKKPRKSSGAGWEDMAHYHKSIKKLYKKINNKKTLI